MPGNTKLTPDHDGFAVTSFREGILVTGGCNLRHTWRFSFRTLEWSAIKAQGQFAPAGRLYHTAKVWNDHLVVTGGITAVPEEWLHVHLLDLTSMRWSRIVPCCPCPEHDMPYPPLARSHHASTVIGDYLYVHGGKPTQSDFTTSDFRELHRQGFYDILIMHLPTGQWSRRAHSTEHEYVPAPPLWGHTMSSLDDSALVLFGGFEIDLSLGTGESSYPSREVFDERLQANPVADAPAAELQNVLNVFSLKALKWSAFAPDVMSVGPSPRALHTSELLRNRELIILGGIAVNEATAEILPVSDAWVWNADNGSWRRLDPMPIPSFLSNDQRRILGARLFSSIYNDQVVISNDITEWHVLDTSDPVEFTVTGSTHSEIFFCACVDESDWQLVRNDPPDEHHNPLCQVGLAELAAVQHPRRGLAAPTTPGPSRTPNHALPLASNSRGAPPNRDHAVRKFLPFSAGVRRGSPERMGHLNPVIAALLADSAH